MSERLRGDSGSSDASGIAFFVGLIIGALIAGFAVGYIVHYNTDTCAPFQGENVMCIESPRNDKGVEQKAEDPIFVVHPPTPETSIYRGG